MSGDPHEHKGPNGRQSRAGLPLVGPALLLLAAMGFIVLFTPVGGKVKRGLQEIFGSETTTVNRKEPEPAPPPEPAPVAPAEQSPLERDPDPIFPTGTLTPPGGVDIRQLSKGINLKVVFKSEEGGLASEERIDDDAYVAEYTLKVRLPRPATTLQELSQTNPDLGTLLPWLHELLPKAAVSAWYKQLYANKAERLKADVGRLDEVLTRHNFYDCETILSLRHEGSGRRVFLMQAEMDVVSDGSDGDRLAAMPDSIVNSTNYQPFTSYRWNKTGDTPNPMRAGWEKRLGNAEKELGLAATTKARKAWLKDRIKLLQRGIADMKTASYLIAEYDPFIVIPTNLVQDRRDPYAPNVGDFAVIVHGKTLYPVIVGDAGPRFKVGEASLRVAKEIDPNANPYRRPVSKLGVTYLVFPRSAEAPKRAPDYSHWRQRCRELLEEVGGLGEDVELHEWKNLLPATE